MLFITSTEFAHSAFALRWPETLACPPGAQYVTPVAKGLIRGCPSVHIPSISHTCHTVSVASRYAACSIMSATVKLRSFQQYTVELVHTMRASHTPGGGHDFVSANAALNQCNAGPQPQAS
jgi:hypothetical protein